MAAWRQDDPVLDGERVSPDMERYTRIREGWCFICGTLPQFCECPDGSEDVTYADDSEEHRVG